jgi:hypothetical protein
MKVKLNLSKTPNTIKKKIKISKDGIKVTKILILVIDKWVIDPALIKDTCANLLQTLEKNKEIEPFKNLISKKDYPDYYEIIENPISLKEIGAKIKKSLYGEMDEFKNDILLMFNNCKTYNQPGSEIYQQATHLSEDFLKTYELLRKGGTKRHLGSTPKNSVESPFRSLVECAKKGDFQGFKNGIDKVMDVNALFDAEMFDAEYTWALIHACSYFGQLAMVQVLMEKGADPEIEDTWYGGVSYLFFLFPKDSFNSIATIGMGMFRWSLQNVQSIN